MTSYLWNTPGIPQKGWECIDVLDLGGAGHICQMCGKEEIRYVHVLKHPEHRPLKVGCVCAGKMTGDYEGAERREREVRNRANRRARWLGREWKVSAKGNQYLKIKGRHLLVFKRSAGGYGIKAGDDFDRRTFPTPSAAKLALFDFRKGES